MAIGFPAYYQKILTYDVELSVLEDVLNELKWPIFKQTSNVLYAHIRYGFMSSGEIIKIHRDAHKTIVRSTCIIPTQFIDFGRNKRNVHLFLRKLNSV